MLYVNVHSIVYKSIPRLTRPVLISLFIQPTCTYVRSSVYKSISMAYMAGRVFIKSNFVANLASQKSSLVIKSLFLWLTHVRSSVYTSTIVSGLMFLSLFLWLSFIEDSVVPLMTEE